MLKFKMFKNINWKTYEEEIQSNYTLMHLEQYNMRVWKFLCLIRKRKFDFRGLSRNQRTIQSLETLHNQRPHQHQLYNSKRLLFLCCFGKKCTKLNCMSSDLHNQNSLIVNFYASPIVENVINFIEIK